MSEAFLFFKLGDQLFAIEQTEILAIGRMKDYNLHPVPTGDISCFGALHHRGRIVPVLDTRCWLLPTEELSHSAPHSDHCFPKASGQLIFYHSRVGPIALYVDSVSHDADLLSMTGQWQFVELSKHF